MNLRQKNRWGMLFQGSSKVFGVRKVSFAPRLILIAFFVLLLCFSTACGIPKILFLDDPLTPREYLQLGLSYENSHQFDLAQEYYQKAADHQVPEAYLFMGNIAYLQKDLKRAETHYRKAIRKMPDDPRAYNNLAWIYYEQKKQLNKAETLARKALELAPPDNRCDYLDTLEKILSVKDP